ncbi:MAG: hypothetical protein HDT14_05375 [Oscillibacter sp.]|nr:hypothetical protein [Oscillibacter sp.]
MENNGTLITETESTLITDVLLDISRERARDAERNGLYTHSPYESYSLINKALEHKDDVAKDLKDCMKQLWSGVKQENEDVVCAFCSEISRVARDSAANN